MNVSDDNLDGIIAEMEGGLRTGWGESTCWISVRIAVVTVRKRLRTPFSAWADSLRP